MIHKLFKGKIGLSTGEFQCLPKNSISGLMRNLATKTHQFRPKCCNISSKKVSLSKTFHKFFKVNFERRISMFLEKFGRVVLNFLTRNFWTYAEFRDEKPSKLCNTSSKRVSLSKLRFVNFWKTNFDVCWKFLVCCFEFFDKKILDLCGI